MSSDLMSQEDLDGHEKKLLALVPDGQSVGNVTLRSSLDWDDKLYWLIRNRLVDRGVLGLGRGRGGSVRLVQSTTVSPPTPLGAATAVPVVLGEPTPSGRIAEDALYEPLAKVLRTEWVKDRRYDDAVVEITARQGSKATGGRWSRPDIVVASLTTYAWVPGKYFDVTTFEVKPFDGFDVTAVYEALAHLRSATRAYVLVHVPEALREPFEETLQAATDEADRHHVGFIVVGDPGDWETWDVRVEARRREPDPGRLNEFLAVQVSPLLKERITKWHR